MTDAAILKIKEMILTGELHPGDRLPPEKELSEALGLSRNSLREAVKALEIIRVLDVRRGDGTYVTSLDPALLMQVMTFVVEIHQDATILELFEVRGILEPAAVAMATHHVTAEDIAGLRDLVDSVDCDTPVEELVAQDLVFHRRIVERSGNRYLISLLDGLSTNTQRARIWRGLTETGAVGRTLAEHHAIVDALAAGDADLARAQAAVHIAGVTSWLRRSLACS